jgi:hypothetical protein
MAMRQGETGRGMETRRVGRKAGMSPAEAEAAKNMDLNKRQSIEELTGGHIKKK